MVTNFQISAQNWSDLVLGKHQIPNFIGSSPIIRYLLLRHFSPSYHKLSIAALLLRFCFFGFGNQSLFSISNDDFVRMTDHKRPFRKGQNRIVHSAHERPTPP